MLSELNFGWWSIKVIKPKDIEHKASRVFIRDLKNSYLNPKMDIYICSDARNSGIRQILNIISYAHVVCSAGNIVEKPSFRPSIIIAHGKSDMKCGCGAVDYVKSLKPGERPQFEALAVNVDKDPIQNAKNQLQKVPEECRAGILFFDHSTATIHKVPGNEQYEWNSVCETLYNRLDKCLNGRYSEEEIDLMAHTQDPELIFFHNISSQITHIDMFKVEIQWKKISQIATDSLGYAMSNSLDEKGSFQNTKSAVFAFDKNNIPEGIQEMISKEFFVKDYILNRGWNLYIVEVGNTPDTKKIYQVVPNA